MVTGGPASAAACDGLRWPAMDRSRLRCTERIVDDTLPLPELGSCTLSTQAGCRIGDDGDLRSSRSGTEQIEAFPEGSEGAQTSKFLFSTPSASADPLLAGVGTAASAVVGCSRERARAASSALADIAAGSRCYPRDVFAAARPLLLARKEERCVGARSRSTSVHSNNSLCSEIGRLANPPS